MKNRTGQGLIIIVIAVIIIIIIIAVVYSLTPPAQPAIAVSNVSLNPNSITAGKVAQLQVTVSNKDSKNHQITLIMNVSQYVQVTGQGVTRQSGVYDFGFTLTSATSELTETLSVTGTLAQGQSSATYPITLAVQVDGKSISTSWQNPVLTVTA